MPDTSTTQNDVADSGRKEKRQAKLKSLMGRRSATTGRKAAGSKGDSGSREELSGPDAATRRKVAVRMYRVLKETPPGDNGMVEGTPFSQNGLTRVLENLKSRAASENQAGAKVASGILKFLSPKDGETDVQGVSLERLQHIATTAEARFKGGT